MASFSTANYQLCQWEPTDQVQRTDFNADNAKIDTAIAGRLGAAELIAETVLTENASPISVDLSGMDWSKWSIVWILLDPVTTSSTSYFSFTIDGILLSITSRLTGEVYPEISPRLFVLFPLRSSTRNAFALRFPGGDIAQSESPFSSITGASAGSNTSNGMAPGCAIRVYGIP